MDWIVVILLLVIIFCFWYIKKLQREIRAHENNWLKIENMTDHNQSGDIVIHTREIK